MNLAKYECDGQMSLDDLKLKKKHRSYNYHDRWHRLSKMPPEIGQRCEVMYTWSYQRPADRTGVCKATWTGDRWLWEGLPFDIGRVVPEAWREVEQEEYEWEE